MLVCDSAGRYSYECIATIVNAFYVSIKRVKVLFHQIPVVQQRQ